MSKVSVSLVTYNHARFIRQALDSVLMQQAEFAFDVVVGDDCSTDGTREIVQAYALAHPDRLVAVLPERNLGDAGRPLFLETLKHCRGAYIAALDGDDYWISPAKLQRQADFLDTHPECSLCYHDALIVSDEGPVPDWTFIPPGLRDFATAEDLIHACFVPGCSSMVRREVVEYFPPWFFAAPWADVPYYMMAAEQGLLGLIREPLGAYRVHGAGVWSSIGREGQVRNAIAMLEALEPPFGASHGKALAQARSRQHVELAGVLAKSGRMSAALGQLVTAIRLDPTLRRTGYLALARQAARHLGRTGVEAGQG